MLPTLPPLPSLSHCRPPVISSGKGYGPDAGLVCVQPLLTAGAYASYNCTACTAGVCGAPQQCTNLGSGGRNCDASSVEFSVRNLEQSTLYE